MNLDVQGPFESLFDPKAQEENLSKRQKPNLPKVRLKLLRVDITTSNRLY